MGSAKQISIFGATGSIGQSTLTLVRQHPEQFSVKALVAGKNYLVLAALAREFHPKVIGIYDASKFNDLCNLVNDLDCDVVAGEQAINDIATMPVDLVIAGISGFAGLSSVMAAVKAGQTIAIANKESLVSAGAVLTQKANEFGAHILPIDSEHNAVFQCWSGWKGHQTNGSKNDKMAELSHICLTASGGPFLTLPLAEFPSITPEAAVKHPNWSMGQKISVDSATMMNKGLEVIEAHWLFGLDSRHIDVLVHPQQAIHGMVYFRDGSIIAQLGGADMRTPISYAMAWPNRLDWGTEPLDLAAIASLTFEAVDPDRFPCFNIARQALETGGVAPAVLNAANEVAVDAFLQGRVGFDGIASIVEATLAKELDGDSTTIEAIFSIDQRARQQAHHLVAKGNIFKNG
jgi:1-deoxy-D-xylulose-5-phosphate reductoisomerase